MIRQFFPLIVMTALCVAVFTSCNKDEEPTTIDKISATLENGVRYDNEISRVGLFAKEPVPNIVGIPPVWVTLAESNFENGRFSMKLPSTVDNEYLKSIYDCFPTTLTASNMNAKAEFFPIMTFDMNNNLFYTLINAKLDEKLVTEAKYMHTDNDCSITGTNVYTSPIFCYDEETEEIRECYTVEETVTYAISLKKGWNIIYRIEKENRSEGYKKILKSEMTTQAIDGLKWYVLKDFTDLQE